jgi:Transposase DDE domain
MNNLSKCDAIVESKHSFWSLPDFFSQVLGDLITKHYPDTRCRIYPPETVVLGLMHRARTGDSIAKTVSYLNSLRIANSLPTASANPASFWEGVKRTPRGFLQDLMVTVAKKTQAALPPHYLWKGLRVKAIDGTTITMNDTPANQLAFPQVGGQKKGVGFPIARLVILQNLMTGMVDAMEFGPYQGKGTGEMSLAKPIIESLEDKDLLIGDRYYPSYFMMAKLMKRKIHGVFQIQGARHYDFRTGEKQGELDHIVHWKRPSKPLAMILEEFNQIPQEIKIRELDVTQDVGARNRIILVTTLHDPKTHTKTDLANLYKRRWEIESCLKNLKDEMGMHHIKENSPKLVEIAILSHLIAHNQIQWFRLSVAAVKKKPVREVSFKATINTLTYNATNIMSATTLDQLNKVRQAMVSQIVQVKVKYRPGRWEPRAVKKRPKPHAKLVEARSEYKKKRVA